MLGGRPGLKLAAPGWNVLGEKPLVGWKLLLPNVNAPGVKELDGLNLNSAAPAFNFESEGLLLWLGRRDELLLVAEGSFAHGLLAVDIVRS